MSFDLETTAADAAPVQGELLDAESSPLTLSLQDFVGEFGDELLDALNNANPPVYTGQPQAHRQLIVASLKRKLFPAQAEVVHAAAELLIDRGERAAIVNGEMGCGKTTVGIAAAAVLNAEGYRRTLVLSPPRRFTNWRRRSRRRWPAPRYGCSMGRIRSSSSSSCVSSWACSPRARSSSSWGASGCGWVSTGSRLHPAAHPPRRRGGLPDCGTVITDLDGEPVNPVALEAEEYHRKCSHCAAPLWTRSARAACPAATSPRPSSKP